MIVTARRMASMICPKASNQPASTIQIMFAVRPSGPGADVFNTVILCS
jgi:hypothetical protein